MPIPSHNPQSRGISTTAATLLAAAALLTLLGHKPLTSWDEGIYAEISREMLGGSWIVPHWNGQPWMEKPPLMLWITASFFKLFGITEFWARAASALSGVAIVGILHAWLGRREGLLAAWFSTIMLLLTFGFLHPARAGEMDTLLSLGCLLAVVGLAAVQESFESRGLAQGWLLFWLGCATVLMTKGAAVVLPVLTLVILALVARWPLRRFGPWFLAGFALFLMIVLPWHIAMYCRFGPVFLHEYLGYHVLSRATQAIEHHDTRWWYFLWVLLVSAPPFCLLYPFSTAAALRRTALRPWALFALVVLFFFSIVRTRLPHYIAPAYPAFTLITAAWTAEKLRRLSLPASIRPTLFRPAATLAGLALFGVAAAITAHGRSGLHTTRTLGSAAPLYPDDREVVGLLRQRIPTYAPDRPAGPLLVWRDGPPVSPATTIFYSRRTVQQIGPAAIRSGDAGYDRYLRATEPLPDALADGAPHLLLLDRSLIARLPPHAAFTQLAASPHFVLGIASKD